MNLSKGRDDNFSGTSFEERLTSLPLSHRIVQSKYASLFRIFMQHDGELLLLPVFFA